MGGRELKPFRHAYNDINDSNKKEPRDLCNFNNVNTRFTNELSNGLSSPPRKTTFFKFCWWNGGGKIKFTDEVLRFSTLTNTSSY